VSESGSESRYHLGVYMCVFVRYMGVLTRVSLYMSLSTHMHVSVSMSTSKSMSVSGSGSGFGSGCESRYGVATVGRLLKIVGLFCRM